MSIKPCPACKGDAGNQFLLGGAKGIWRECNCGASGPRAESVADADAAWNALPREPAWRAEPPDQPGVYLINPANPHHRPKVVRYRGGPIRREEFFGDRWFGPIPNDETDAEKETAK